MRMKEKVQNMSKQTKILLASLVGVVIVTGAVTMILYGHDNQERIVATQEAYGSLIIPAGDNYNVEEKEKLQELLDKRDVLFHNLQFIELQNLQSEFDVLDQSVKQRIELDKKFEDKKTEVEGINILDGANDAEVEIFNTRKAQVLSLIEQRQTDEVINEAIATLKSTNDDIQKRLDNERLNANRGGGYHPTPPRGNGGGSQGGGNRGQGGNSRPGGGASAGQEVCVRKPDGSEVCVKKD